MEHAEEWDATESQTAQLNRASLTSGQFNLCHEFPHAEIAGA
jgi:hypothetical protein